MANKKHVREKGKLSFSRYFQHLKEGDSVAVVRELAKPVNFPERIQGKTGEVESKRGRAYLIKIKDGKADKRYLIEPIHLKKIKTIENRPSVAELKKIKTSL